MSDMMEVSLPALARNSPTWTSRLTGQFAGFVNFTAKDTREWLRTRRALWTFLTAQALVLLGVMTMPGQADHCGVGVAVAS